MHIRTKFDGGKQINRSQSGGWDERCAGASLRLNHGPGWGPKVWEQVTGGEANQVFKAASIEKTKQVENDRKRKSTNDAKSSRRAAKYKKTNDNSLQARSDYARHDDGPQVREVHNSVPQVYLQGLMLDFYRANVVVSQAKAIEMVRGNN